MASPIGEGSLTIMGFYEFMFWKAALQVKWGGLFGPDSTWGPGWGVLMTKWCGSRWAEWGERERNDHRWQQPRHLFHGLPVPEGAPEEHRAWILGLGWYLLCPQLYLRAWCAGGFGTVSADGQSELSHADLVHILVLSLGQLVFEPLETHL